MSTTTLERPATTTTPVVRAAIPNSRLVGVELQKMFDTRSGFWLVTGVAVLSLIATAATMLFGDRSTLEYGDFAQAVGIPTTVILPVLGALADATSITYVYKVCAFLPLIGLLTVFLPNFKTAKK